MIFPVGFPERLGFRSDHLTRVHADVGAARTLRESMSVSLGAGGTHWAHTHKKQKSFAAT